MLISRKMIGEYRHIKTPYGKPRQYQQYVIGGVAICPIKEILVETGKIVYSKSDWELIHQATRSESNAKRTDLKMEKATEFVPDKMQPIFYIYEEVEDIKGKVITHAEARFARNVPYYAWKKYPFYPHPIYWIH